MYPDLNNDHTKLLNSLCRYRNRFLHELYSSWLSGRSLGRVDTANPVEAAPNQVSGGHHFPSPQSNSLQVIFGQGSQISWPPGYCPGLKMACF